MPVQAGLQGFGKEEVERERRKGRRRVAEKGEKDWGRGREKEEAGWGGREQCWHRSYLTINSIAWLQWDEPLLCVHSI